MSASAAGVNGAAQGQKRVKRLEKRCQTRQIEPKTREVEIDGHLT